MPPIRQSCFPPVLILRAVDQDLGSTLTGDARAIIVVRYMLLFASGKALIHHGSTEGVLGHANHQPER